MRHGSAPGGDRLAGAAGERQAGLEAGVAIRFSPGGHLVPQRPAVALMCWSSPRSATTVRGLLAACGSTFTNPNEKGDVATASCLTRAEAHDASIDHRMSIDQAAYVGRLATMVLPSGTV